MLIAQILGHTPIWVWLLLAFLVSRGVLAMRPREVSPARVLILPIVFFLWGLSGLLGAGGGLWLKLALFAVALLAGLAGGRALAFAMPAPRLSRETGLLAMPGSPIPLILICVAFAVKYIGNVALAMNSDAAIEGEISGALTLFGGAFAGLFWGRTLGQFQRALQADGGPSGLAQIVALMRARPAREVGRSEP